jgi:hypothetical protein
MEKLLPDLAVLTDEQFETFFKRTTANKYGRDALAELVPPTPAPAVNTNGGADTTQNDGTAAKTTAEAVMPTETNTTPKPTEKAKNAS